MVLSSDSANRSGDRRNRLRLLGSSWRHSWRSSDRTLESREDSKDDRKVLRVHFPRDDIAVPMSEKSTETISADEMEAQWYQSSDYTKFEKDRVLTTYGYIAASNRGVPFDEETYSLRGLENLTDKKLGVRVAKEQNALRKALKAEEERQKEADIFPDLAQFRNVCVQHSRSARDRAVAVANEDAKFVHRESRGESLSLLPLWRRRMSDVHEKSCTQRKPT